MQRFLGAANFHRGFSSKYADICSPLEELRNVKAIEWTEKQIKAFEDLKLLFSSDILLRPIDWSKQMTLTTDASLIGIGAWIGQMDTEDNLQPVICISKKLNPTQTRWSATKRELYAMMWAMTKLRHYLLGRHFIVQVDHKPLVNMFKEKISILMEGWIDKILEFDFAIEHIPGDMNELADALSRLHDETEIHVKQMTIDPNVHNVEVELEAMRRGKQIPSEEERKAIIQEQHLLGHFSMETMTTSIWREGYWWPGIRKDIQAFINTCIDCQRFDLKKEGYHPMKSIEASEPWDHIQIDLIGPLPTSTNGYSYILTIVDVFTGYSIIRSQKTKSEEETALSLWQVICDFGIPKIIQSDNGTEFVNKVVQQLTLLYGIDHRLITPYNPRANGQVERKNKEVSRLLKKEMMAASDKWEQLLPFCQLSLNYKELERTGSKPFELFFGRPFNLFMDYNDVTSELSISDILKQRLEHLKHLHAVVYPAISEEVSLKRKERNQKFDNTHKILETLKPGMIVMVLDQTRKSKWDPIYEGPFTISRVTRNGTYYLLDNTGKELNLRFAVNQLKVLDVPSGKGLTDSNLNDSESMITKIVEEEAFEIEEILDHQLDKEKKNYNYLIHWKGYDDSYNSWINESQFNSVLSIRSYWNKLNQGKRVRKTKSTKKI